MNKEYCKNLIGKNVFDIRHNNRKGTLKKIQFSSKCYSVCWFLFQYKNGAYLVSTDDIKIINKQTQLNLSL